MRKAGANALLAVACFAIAAQAGSRRQAPPAPAPAQARRVAVTFDDVPFLPETEAGTCDPNLARSDNERLLDLISQRRIPTVGLIVPGRRCGNNSTGLMRDLLRSWLDAGLVLGNHTYTHPDLEQVTLDSYTADIIRSGGVLDELQPGLAGTPRYFRAPSLHMGSSPEKWNGLKGFLSRNAYIVAPVTIDNQEWVYAAAYDRSQRRADTVQSARVVTAYITHMKESFDFYEGLSRELFGREIPQVLLVHANQLNVDHLDDLLGMIRKRGYSFISLDEALKDSAYRSPDTYMGSRGFSWLQRWAITRGIPVGQEPREVAWVASLAGGQ
jgi:peptidoglycan/xylan/chitin deacetylase (PgdA/CDA1 family)